MTHSIIIASLFSTSCNTLLSMINTSESGYTVVGIAPDPETLFQLIHDNNPSVILVDCTSASAIGYEQIQQIRTTFGFELQILAMGPRDFTSVYRAIQSGANNYLLFPIQQEALFSCLSTLTSAHEKIQKKDTASRRFFLTDNSIDVLRDHPLSTRQLNATYGTHFSEGLFQMLFIKFDFPNSFERLNTENTPIFLHLSEFITEYFKEDCTDIIYELKKDGIMILLNYESASQVSVSSRIFETHDRVSRLVRTYRSLDITICVSSTVDDPCKVWEIKKQVRDAEWSRMSYGINKLIFYLPIPEGELHLAENRLAPIMKNISVAISALDIHKFKLAINEFFMLSPNILISRAARTSIRQIVSQLFQIYWDTISCFTDPADCYDTLSYCLHLCTSFDQYKTSLYKQCAELMEQIAAQSSRTYSPAVLQTIEFIKNNVDKPILLEDVAAETQLSKGYLSFLFKKETGTNFTKYVSHYKNSVACDLLKTSNLNISEIANQIGMIDVRAFSKKFHALNGSTPSYYRKLHHTKKVQIL